MKISPPRSPTARQRGGRRRSLFPSVRLCANYPVLFRACLRPENERASAERQNERAKRARPRAQLRWHHHWRRPSRPRARRLSRQGWTRILVVERRLDYGGGLSTKEVTEPGFYHNLHSINHFQISEAPWFKDLGLGERVTYITPRYEFGQAHSDGTALVLGRDLEETVANIARFSKKDAATFREWNRKGERITANIFLPERYSEPLP